MTAPHVLFVCVENGGTSQKAAGLVRAADLVDELARRPTAPA
ncbi:hypothetical protein ACFQ46_02525 [Kineococcus sp. GCM10028916]